MLKEKYEKEVVPMMQKKFGYKNVMMVPKIEKIVVNVGCGKMIAKQSSGEQKKIIKNIVENIDGIAGQKSILTRAKKSIAAFKIRKGMPVGVRTTLRRKKMYDFLERLINFGLPRTRGFQGIDVKKFDKAGNLSIGIKEHVSFLEASTEQLKDIFPFQVTINTTGKNREESIELLRLMGLPIKK